MPSARMLPHCPLLLLLAATLTGCGGQPPPRVTVVEQHAAPAPEDPTAERLRADPAGYLRELAQRCNAIPRYRLIFYRQERLGLISKQLTGMEKIQATFRHDPFSVKFVWLSEDPDYWESFFVKGANDDKLVARERKGFSIFPAQVRRVNITDPVKWGRSLNPVTDFGLARLSERTLMPFDDPAVAPKMTVRYEGVARLDIIDRPAHHLVIERPPTPGYLFTRQDFYIDAETRLPAGTDLWLENGELGARYRYAEVDLSGTVTDDDFKLSSEEAGLKAKG